MRRPLSLLLIAAFTLPACRRSSDEEALDAAAASRTIAPDRDNLPLTAKLEQIEAELAATLREPDDDALMDRLLRAEAVTDRLLESKPPFAWLAQAYDVEARLRQIQALADRIVAEVRRGQEFDAIRSDVLLLYRSVVELREGLGRPGRDAPAPLDSLLRLDSGRVAPSPTVE